MNFKDLGLEPELLSAISAHGYSTPTPIQVGAIPPVLAGHDLLAGAQTGTGKTAAFVLPLLQLLHAAAGRGPRALVLAPTRELAAQILESIRVYGANKKLPFAVEDFLLSFSIPNFHFHATTAYDILRMKGLPLGKRDYLVRL